MVICSNKFIFFFLNNLLINYMIKLRYLCALTLFLAKCFHAKLHALQRRKKIFPLRLNRSWKARPKEWSGSWFCSLPQSYISLWLGQCHIVILILDLFLQLVQALHICLCLNWTSLENAHRVYLYFRTSQISDTTIGSHVVQDLNINTFINCGLSSAKIFSLACFL